MRHGVSFIRVWLKWQALEWFVDNDSRFGRSVRQMSAACGHREWNAQPEGTADALAGSPMISGLCLLAEGSGRGIEASNKRV